MDGIQRLNDPNWWREQAMGDLYFLCRTLMRTLESNEYGYQDLYYPTHKRICDFIQDYAQPGQVLLVFTPRHWIKSYIITVGWTVQRILRNLTSHNRESILLTNATINNATAFLEKIKFNFRFNNLLKGLFADVIPDNPAIGFGLWTQDEIELNGTYVSTGAVEKNLVSQHHMVIINDDLVNRENSDTASQLEKVYDWWALEQSLLHPRGIEIIIGTRWHYEDLYGRLIEKFIQPKQNYWFGKTIVEMHNGKYHLLQMDCWKDPVARTGSTFPTLFPEEELHRLERELGERFYGQYENNPLNKGINPFTSKWFTRYVASSMPEIRYTTMLIDPAGKAKSEDSSYSGISIVSFGVDKKAYIEYGKRWLITDMKLAEKIIEIALQFRPDTIGIEEVKYQTIYDLLEIVIYNEVRMKKKTDEEIEYLKTLLGRLFELKPKGRPKEVRIRQLAGYFESGQFLLPHGGTEELEEEMIRFPSSKNDIVDSLAYSLDVIIWPHKDDPPKYLSVPDKLKMTDEERIEEEWNSIRESAPIGGADPAGFREFDLY